MAGRVLDTNKHSSDHWKRFRPAGEKTELGAEIWAKRSYFDRSDGRHRDPGRAGNARRRDLNERDRRLTRAYLKPFRVIDQGADHQGTGLG